MTFPCFLPRVCAQCSGVCGWLAGLAEQAVWVPGRGQGLQQGNIQM